ncbi:MAG: response regulator [Candidatus Marinimicrobia bacterium]|nr:response regulator [Candidatus Neomarinimicrobiota bacterium]
MNILIIYDLAMNRAIIERILRMDGHVTVGASRLEDLTSLLAGKSRFDVVICELLRPEIDGIRIYKDYLGIIEASKGKGGVKRLPWILMAAAQTEKSAAQTSGKYRYAKELGFFDIISKPLDHDRLRSSLRRISEMVKPKDQVEHLGDLPKRIKEVASTITAEHDAVGATMLIDLMEGTILMLRTVVKYQTKVG